MGGSHRQGPSGPLGTSFRDKELGTHSCSLFPQACCALVSDCVNTLYFPSFPPGRHVECEQAVCKMVVGSVGGTWKSPSDAHPGPRALLTLRSGRPERGNWAWIPTPGSAREIAFDAAPGSRSTDRVRPEGHKALGARGWGYRWTLAPFSALTLQRPRDHHEQPRGGNATGKAPAPGAWPWPEGEAGDTGKEEGMGRLGTTWRAG